MKFRETYFRQHWDMGNPNIAHQNLSQTRSLHLHTLVLVVCRKQTPLDTHQPL